MHSALRPGSVGVDLHADSPWVARRNKLVIGSIAALSAGVIAAAPAAQNGAALENVHAAQQRSVELVAAVTDSVGAVYGDLVNDTVYNVGTLLKQYAAQPFPILSAIIANQEGYLKRIFDLSAASTAFQTWWETGTRESAPGKTLLANFQSALATGNLFSAYDMFNKLTLFGVQNTVLPWLNGWLFSTTTTQGIPQQIAQNVADALGSFFTTGTLVFGAFQAVYAPVSGAAFELSRSLGSVGSALGSGNLAAAINALVNVPGVVLNAFVNGFDYDVDGTTNPWAGLLSPKDPNCTGRCAGGGPISQFFITIAQKIAAAIKNTPAVTTPVATTAAATSLVSANVDTTATTYTLTVDGGSTATENAEDAASETADAVPEAGSSTVITPESTETEVPAEAEISTETDTPADAATEAGTEADTETPAETEPVEDAENVVADDAITEVAPKATARHGVTAKKPASQSRSAAGGRSSGGSSPKGNAA